MGPQVIHVLPSGNVQTGPRLAVRIVGCFCNTSASAAWRLDKFLLAQRSFDSWDQQPADEHDALSWFLLL
jgi:hypothetical protein